MITLCIFLAFPVNMANALEEKTDSLEKKADALEEPLDALEEKTEDIQPIEIENIDEEDEVIDSSVPEPENITETSEENPEYHRGDVEAINKMIKNGSIKNWEYNNPESWASDGVRFYTVEHETGEGRRIEELALSPSSNCVLTGSIDLRELEYLRIFHLHNIIGQEVHTVTEINADGLKHLEIFMIDRLSALTVLDISNTVIGTLFLANLQNMTTFIMKDAAINVIPVFIVPNLKQFTNTKGNTLVIESNGPGEVLFESYNHTSEQFTLRANPEMVIGMITGFSHWTATPNGVNFVLPTNQLSRTVTFTIRDDVDTTMTAWFQPEPIVSAPVIDKDSITTTGVSFSGTVQLFGVCFDRDIEYRKKGEDEWIHLPYRVLLMNEDQRDPLKVVDYVGSFSPSWWPSPTILQPATTYELRVRITNDIGTIGRSEIVEFTTLSIVTIRHVESKSDGSYSVLDDDDKIMHIHFGSEIEINAGEYPGLTGIHYRLMKDDGSGDIEDTIYALGTNLKIVDNTTIIVYHASTVVDVTYPKEMEFYAHYSDGGSVKTKEDYSFVNNSALPVMVNLERYDVKEKDGINFVANAVNDGDMHLSLLPTTSNNNGFTTAITNIQPNTPLNRSLGTLGGYALGGNGVGSFTIGGKYAGVFYVQPRRPKLEFVFSFEIDWEKFK